MTEQEMPCATDLRYPDSFSCSFRHCLNPACKGMPLQRTTPKKIILLGIHFFREAWHFTWGCNLCGCEYGAWDTIANGGVEVWNGVGFTLPWIRAAEDEIYAFKAPMTICKRLIADASKYMLLGRRTSQVRLPRYGDTKAVLLLPRNPPPHTHTHTHPLPLSLVLSLSRPPHPPHFRPLPPLPRRHSLWTAPILCQDYF